MLRLIETIPFERGLGSAISVCGTTAVEAYNANR